MCQKDKLCIGILNKIRVGEHTIEDINHLNIKYTRKPINNTHVAHLYFTNQAKNKHNNKIFEKTLGQTYILQAKDYKHSTCSKRVQIPKNAKDTTGLHQIIKLKISMVIEICSGKLDILDSLVNGVEAICMGVTTKGHEEVIWVKFKDARIGQGTRQENLAFYNSNTPKTWTPIKKIFEEF